MQKAIYRHIRLKKGFKNEEMVDGMSKLRIPDILLKEKMRTQSRFDVSKHTSATLHIYKKYVFHFTLSIKIIIILVIIFYIWVCCFRQ